MGEKIALGFHTCVDFEMTWDAEVVEQMIREFDVRDADLADGDIPIDSVRAPHIQPVAYEAGNGMRAGARHEPDLPGLC